jgi:hypothetical protein
MSRVLQDILALMEVKAEKALQDGSIYPKWGKAISDLAGRRHPWVYQSTNSLERT